MITREELQQRLERVSVSKTLAFDSLKLPKAEYMFEDYVSGVKQDLTENMLEDTKSHLHNKPPTNKNFVYYQIQDVCKLHGIDKQYGSYCGLPANRFLNLAALFEEVVYGFRACEMNLEVAKQMQDDLKAFNRKRKSGGSGYIQIWEGDIFEYLRLLPRWTQNQIALFDFDFNGHLTKHVDDIINAVEKHGTDKCVVAAWASIGHVNMSEDKDYLPLIERLYNGWKSYKIDNYRRYAYQDNVIPMRVELLMLSRVH